jgi:hypothetical protein
MDNKIKLKVDDQLYLERSGIIVKTLKIERVTKTQAISGQTRFKRIQSSGSYILAIGSGLWDRSYYYLRTDELDKKYIKQRTIRKLTNTNWSLYSSEELILIDELLMKIKNDRDGQ